MEMTQDHVNKLPPYQYRALEHSDNTRLLCLHPGSHGEPIECSLYDTSLDLGEYRYCALSYAWGDAQLLHAISCNGKRMKITQNLSSALKRLRKESEETMLWVDALCIDQSTEPDALRERARQVEMMHIIFGSAERVIVDLGEVDEDTPVLLSSFALFNQVPLQLWAKPLEDWPKDILAKTFIPKMKGSFWPTFARFLQRPWLGRVWMFQEFVLAKELVFLLGIEFYPETFLSQSILPASECFLHILNLGSQFSLGDMTLKEIGTRILTGYQAARCKVYLRQCHQSSVTELLNLATLMHMTQWLKATNLQDRVYALLSLTASAVSTTFPVVYTESSDETALRLSLLLLEQCPLYLLYRCVGVDSSQASWSLTLEHRQIDALQTTWEPGGLNLWFRACGKSDLSIALNRTDLSLTVKGVAIGRVANVTLTWQPPDAVSFLDLSQSDVFAPFRDISIWIEDQSSSSSRRYTPENFWRTLVADLVQRNLRAYRSRDFPDFPKSLTAFTRYIFDHARSSKTPEQRAEIDELTKQVWLYLGCLPLCVGRRLAVLESEIPCLVPGNTCIGDVLCILTGAPLPLVLRPQGESFRIVGCCYIHDMMDGQLFENENENELPDITEIIIR